MSQYVRILEPTALYDSTGVGITSTSTSLNVNVTGGTVISTTTTPGFVKANTPVYNDYSSTNVTNAAYVQLIASTTATTTEIEIFESGGFPIYLATGAAASEVDQLLIFPGGNGRIRFAIPAGTRVSVKSVTASSSTVGFLAINLYG